MTAITAPTIANIIEIRHARPMVSSLTIAELFERRHDNVLAAIRRVQETQEGLLIRKETSLDSQGKERPVYWLDEEAALVVMPFIGGRKAVDGQRKLVRAYLHYRDHFANPPRADLIAAKRAAHNPMMDALIEFREDAGKTTGAVHFMSENKLCNWALAGRFAAVDEKTLSNEDIELLRLIRERNAAYLLAGLDYETRKHRLSSFAIRARTKLLAQDRAA